MRVVKTYSLKSAIYQMVVQSTVFRTWATTNLAYISELVDEEQPVGTSLPETLVAEIASDSPSETVLMPTIRYRIVNNRPEQPSRPDIRNVTFDWYVESNTNNTDQIDELLDLIRDIFLENEGRALGIFTETEGYKDALEVEDDSQSLMTWDMTELSRGMPSDSEFAFSTNSNFLPQAQSYHFGYVRLEMTVADARSIV